MFIDKDGSRDDLRIGMNNNKTITKVKKQRNTKSTVMATKKVSSAVPLLVTMTIVIVAVSSIAVSSSVQAVSAQGPTPKAPLPQAGNQTQDGGGNRTTTSAGGENNSTLSGSSSQHNDTARDRQGDHP